MNIFFLRFTSFSAFNGAGGAGGGNQGMIKSSSTSTKIVNGKKFVTKKLVLDCWGFDKSSYFLFMSILEL